jgi:hypothetical protein
MPPLPPSYILDFYLTHITFAYYGKLFDEEYVHLCTTKLEASVDFDFGKSSCDAQRKRPATACSCFAFVLFNLL